MSYLEEIRAVNVILARIIDRQIGRESMDEPTLDQFVAELDTTATMVDQIHDELRPRLRQSPHPAR